MRGLKFKEIKVGEAHVVEAFKTVIVRYCSLLIITCTLLLHTHKKRHCIIQSSEPEKFKAMVRVSRLIRLQILQSL